MGTILPAFRWLDPPAALAGQAYAHALAHDQAGSDPRYAGLIAWCGFDYYSGPPPAGDAWERVRIWRAMKTPGVADGSDATRITFRAADAYGNHRPGVTGDVALFVRGPAVLIGSNPFPFGEPGGVGGAFLRSVPAATGAVTITARHPGLGEAAVAVRVSQAHAGTA